MSDLVAINDASAFDRFLTRLQVHPLHPLDQHWVRRLAENRHFRWRQYFAYLRRLGQLPHRVEWRFDRRRYKLRGRNRGGPQ